MLMSIERLLGSIGKGGNALEGVDNGKCDPQVVVNYVRLFQKEKDFYRLLVFIMYIAGIITGLLFFR